jgi:ABC-type glutathione transport system ATPase component
MTAVTRDSATAAPLLEIESADVVLGRGWRAAAILSGVSLRVWPGEIVGLVGETGSGKTTLARTVVGLIKPKRGRVVFDGKDISARGRCAVRLPGPAPLARPGHDRRPDRG